MDIAVSVSTGINEVSEFNPNLSFKGLFRSGITIGRDNVSSMANTMILAFTGTFFVALITFRLGNSDFNMIINSSDISIEVIRAVAATSALILIAPLRHLSGLTYIEAKTTLKPPILEVTEKGLIILYQSLILC